MLDRPLSHLISERGFDRFQSGLMSRFAAYQIEYELTYSESSDNPSMRLDFDSLWHLGRVTVWESGHCDMEILKISSGKTVFYEHHQLKSDREFHTTYSKLVVFMRDAYGPWSSAAGKPTQQDTSFEADVSKNF